MTVEDRNPDREEAIRVRARAIWERVGRPDGKDIEHWRQAEEEIAAELRFRLVVEAAPNAMVMVNHAGEIVMVNAQAERVFGYPRAALLGQPVEMLVPERFRDHHPELREAFFAGKADGRGPRSLWPQEGWQRVPGSRGCPPGGRTAADLTAAKRVIPVG
jgi:PAS domain S-box-containing protein